MKEAKEKYILFSPIGGTDPISRDGFDGPMLHICRIYHPEKVVFYLSSEMLKHQENDDRYRKCLNLLAENEGFETDIEIEPRAELTDVYDFEIFYNEFKPLLEKYRKKYPDYEMLLNISSGTPQMQANLYMLASFLSFPVTLVQTTTPANKQNEKLGPIDNYNTDDFWNNNFDNHEEFRTERAKSVKNQNLNIEIQKRNIFTLLKSYDYTAALDMAKSNDFKELINPEAVKLLEAAKMRSELNAQAIKSAKIKKQFGVVDNYEPGRLELAEYLLWMQMKYKRGDYGDYLRAMTPALFELMKIAVEEAGEFPITRICCDEENSIIENKLLNEVIGRQFTNILGYTPQGNFKSDYYDKIIKKNHNNKPWTKPLRSLRNVEANIRNPLAHTITRIDKDWLERELYNRHEEKNKNNSQPKNFTQINTIAGVQDAFKKSVTEINKSLPDITETKLNVDWDAYDKMNDLIITALDKPLASQNF